MIAMKAIVSAALAAAVLWTGGSAQEPPLPAGYWPLSKSDQLLSRTATIRLAPDLSRLAAGERAALQELLQAGRIMQRLYEKSRHRQALEAHDALLRLHERLGRPKATSNLLTLYDLAQGPVANTLDNRREPFLPVDPPVPGVNVYPADVTRDEIESFLKAHPESRPSILAERTVVRRATADNLRNDLAAAANPAVATLHADVARRLQALSKTPDPRFLYAVPYAVAHVEPLLRVFRHLTAAADHVESADEEFARYLRNRARDLLSNDYESGDASWVTGRFKRLNAQIGAYETYDDALYGTKAFYSTSILLQNEAATADLRSRLGGLQEIENALPYDRQKRVKEDISVGVYEVVADFGQARGTNTATILPNDPLFSRRYGRTILLRENIMKHPDLFAADTRIWREAVAEAHAAELTGEGAFQRTLWHEVGHYLGVERDRNGRPLDTALEEYADALEEMKADLVSLFAFHELQRRGRVSETALREVQASGIRRVILNNRPRPDQPYQRMQLAQFNYFLDKGLLSAERESARLTIHRDRYRDVVTSLLREVLAVQYSGDKAGAATFFERWGGWTPELHDRLAARVRAVQGPRFRLVRYAALDH
jgi:hypothetical protein